MAIEDDLCREFAINVWPLLRGEYVGMQALWNQNESACVAILQARVGIANQMFVVKIDGVDFFTSMASPHLAGQYCKKMARGFNEGVERFFNLPPIAWKNRND